MTDRLRLVPVEGCESGLYQVTVPITFQVRALDKKDVNERVRVRVDGAIEGSICVGLPFIAEVEEETK